MRILVCAAYTPYPARGGGRADIWRRIEAFTKLGHSVMLLHHYDPDGPLRPEPEHFAEMDAVLSARYSFPITDDRRRQLRQLINLWRLPWPAANAVPAPSVVRQIDEAVHDFRPDLIWLDGPAFGELARRYREEVGARLVYRSHNIEHVYLRRLARASPRLRNRIAWTLSTVGLKSYELTLMRSADRVFDISLDDISFWRDEGVQEAEWLPPLPELALGEAPASTEPSEILFVGGLSLPHNVQAVRWFIHQVLPLVRARVPGASLTVVGSSARQELRDELEAADVRTFFDVPSVNPYLLGARVLINPVSVGSGIQLKMLDMLMTDAPIVTRAQGARGFPAECAEQFIIADDAEGFAAAVVGGLTGSTVVDSASRAAVRSTFTLHAIETALNGVSNPPTREQRMHP